MRDIIAVQPVSDAMILVSPSLTGELGGLIVGVKSPLLSSSAQKAKKRRELVKSVLLIAGLRGFHTSWLFLRESAAFAQTSLS